MRGPPARVFTIAPEAPFLPTLAEALLDGSLVGEAPLGEALIFLPTRGVVRAFTAVLRGRRGGRALLGSRILSLGESEEVEEDFGGGFEGAKEIAPPIPPLERRLILTRLIQAWSAEVDRTSLSFGPGAPVRAPALPADAMGLAGDLERLMDDLTAEGLSWDGLGAAAETDHSRYFELTLRFLRIAAETWPTILAERGACDPAQRRIALLRTEAERLRRERPDAPVVAAGSTGSIPATASLLAAVAGLPRGAVVLPGLDTDLDDAGWAAIGGDAIGGDADGATAHSHPQATLRRLLAEALSIERSAVTVLGRTGQGGRMRARVVSEALRPAETTDRWAELPTARHREIVEAGVAGLSVVEAADEREEALAAAVALRETLEEPGRTAVLVTPDRGLAARVVAELARWDVAVENEAGIPLADTRAGRLARLAADAAAHGFDPIRVLALLAHPDLRLGLPRAVVERGASALEIGALRATLPRPGLDGLARALEACRNAEPRHAPQPRRRLSREDRDLAALLLERLAAAFAGFAADDGAEGNLLAVADAHRRTLDALREGAAGEEPEEDGGSGALSDLFGDLASSAAGPVRGRLADYPAFFTALARERLVPPARPAASQRVRVLAPAEARLLHADRVVLGGLDEGVWPPRAETGAFLDRAMRDAVGLSPPEQIIGEAARDFAQGLGVADAVVTRARKRGGQPAVPSRLLQRIGAFCGEGARDRMTARGDRFLRLARALDERPPAPPLERPAPRPDPAFFPRTLGLAEIETLLRDPYAVFARHVLTLEPLEPVGSKPRRGEPGRPDPCGARALRRLVPDGSAVRPGRPPLADRPRPVRAARREPPGPSRRMVAALRALGRRVPALGGGAPGRPPAGPPGRLRVLDLPVERREHVHAARPRRPDRGSARRVPDHRRFQDGRGAERARGVLRLRPAADPPGRHAQAWGLRGDGADGGDPGPSLRPRLGRPRSPRAEAGQAAAGRDAHRRRSRRRARAAPARGHRAFRLGQAGFPSRSHPRYADDPSPYDHLARVTEWSLASPGGEDAP
jgi:ATP-dependent helicase/nuclease subunit B